MIFCMAKRLMMLIALHLATAVHHQVVLEDGLLRRMRFGKRAV